ncbi:multidrug resistance-associated protein 5 [Tanacetum coccineum]
MTFPWMRWLIGLRWRLNHDATEGVEAKTNTTDKGKEKVSQDATKVVEARSTVESNYESEYEIDDDSDFSQIKMNEPNDKNSMHADNVRCETFEEHDIYMDELLKSLKTADKNGITEDPFIYVEKHMERYPMYDETTHRKLRKPKVGEKYVSVAQFKECLTYYTLETGFSLWYERSGEVRVVAKYGQRPPRLSALEKGKQKKQTTYPSTSSDDLPTCPWRCYSRWMTDEKTFQCISLEDEHTCVRNFNFGSLVNYKWIAKVFGEKIRANLDIRLCDIVDLVMKKYKCKASPNQCTNAKKYALVEYEKTVGEHNAMLRSYGKALLDSNLRSTIKLGVTVNPDANYFDSPNQGEILTAIGNLLHLEGMGITTFTKCRGNGLTLMSHQHKGFVEAVKDVMPNVEHRQCARHIYENFRKHYFGLEFGNLFWAASKASYPQLFNKIIDKIKRANLNEHKYLMDKNPKTWSRAFLRLTKVVKQFCHVIPAGGNLFEVRSGSEGFTVNEGKKTCSCRMWQLSGILCVYAIKSMYSTVLPSKPKKCQVGLERKESDLKVEVVVQLECRPIKKQSVVNLEDVDVDVRGAVRDRSEQGDNGEAQQGVGGSKRKAVSSAGTQKRQGKKRVGTSGFTR